MKVGDLVTWSDKRYPEWSSLLGVITRQVPGWGEYQIVLWNNGTQSSVEKKCLRVVNESR